MASREERVLAIVAHVATLPGVRWAMIANPDGALADGAHTGLQPAAANDVARTVRRMVVASTTATAPLREMLVNFGPSRMLLRPSSEDSILIVLIDRDTDTQQLRASLDDEVVQLREVLEQDEADDEIGQAIEQLRNGELGPLIDQIEVTYTRHARGLGRSPTEIESAVQAQLRDWLSDCNPSTYTLPLLLDGLGESLAAESRDGFLDEVQELLREAGALR